MPDAGHRDGARAPGARAQDLLLAETARQVIVVVSRAHRGQRPGTVHPLQARREREALVAEVRARKHVVLDRRWHIDHDTTEKIDDPDKPGEVDFGEAIDVHGKVALDGGDQQCWTTRTAGFTGCIGGIDAIPSDTRDLDQQIARDRQHDRPFADRIELGQDDRIR
nr:hypothetical protein [Thermomicrobium sp.]